MAEMGETKIIHNFFSTINEESINQFEKRFGKSRKIFLGIGTICMILFLSGLGIIPSLVLVFIGFLLGGIISGFIAFIILSIVIYNFVKSKINPIEKSKDYHIEMYGNHMILNSGVTKSKKIEYNQIQKIKKYNRPQELFSSNDIDAYLEQESYPYFHIATTNNNLYLIEIKEMDSNNNKVIIDYIVDIDDLELFKKIIVA